MSLHHVADNLARLLALYARTAIREFVRQSLAALIALALAITAIGMVSAACILALTPHIGVSLALIVVAVAHLLLALFIGASIFLHHRR